MLVKVGPMTHFFIVGTTMDDLIQRVTSLVLPIIEQEQLELIEVVVKGRPGSQLLKIFVDSEDGVNLNQCTNVSRQLSEQLDVSDLFPKKYTLEVSSPGISRPLKNYRDFKKNVNRDVQLVYQEGEESVKVSGKITRVSENEVDIKSKNEVKSIPFSKINYGKINLPW